MSVQKLNALFEKSGVGSVLLRSGPSHLDYNISYYSGNHSKLFNGFMVLKKGKKPVLLQSVLEEVPQNRSMDIMQYSSEKQFHSVLSKLLGKKVGLNLASYPAKNYLAFKKKFSSKKILDISEHLASAREVKSSEEQNLLKESAKIAERAFEYFENVFRKGMTEKELAQKISDFYKKAGSEEAFPAIVAFAENSCIPHHQPASKRIDGRGLLVIDTGAKYRGYCSDLTRTYCIGNPLPEEKEAYQKLLQVKQLAQQEFSSNKKISKAISPVLGFYRKSFNAKMMHSLGHGIGLEEHDFPQNLSEENPALLKEGMCIALEPAYYSKENRFGIRLEDNYIVSKQEAIPISSAPKELVSI